MNLGASSEGLNFESIFVLDGLRTSFVSLEQNAIDVTTNESDLSLAMGKTTKGNDQESRANIAPQDIKKVEFGIGLEGSRCNTCILDDVSGSNIFNTTSNQFESAHAVCEFTFLNYLLDPSSHDGATSNTTHAFADTVNFVTHALTLLGGIVGFAYKVR